MARQTIASTAAALTAGTASNGSPNAGDEWNAAASGTLGAWNFGDANQPPALVYNDYDGTSSGTDHCARFEAARSRCGALIPGQRAATSPQIGTTSSDIQLTSGDSVSSVTGNITLPASIMVGGNTINLMWSVHHDPEAVTANQVTLGSGQLMVNAGSRTSTRQVILRAVETSGSTLVNDYHLRIIQSP